MDDWNELKLLRRIRRDALIAARMGVAPNEHKGWSERITGFLEAGFLFPANSVVAFCWPYKNEFDARFVIRRWRDSGVIAALPVVIAKREPLQFRRWWPGAPLIPGVYGIPVPTGTETLLPDVAVVPMNGFDERGYRLGYGGGYFDRTLAVLERRVITIGVSFELSRLPTIHPQPHDIPMDFVVTEVGIYRAGGSNLELLDVVSCMTDMRSLLKERGLACEEDASTTVPGAPLATTGYSSPPCYAHEIAPDCFAEAPKMTTAAIVELLNVLLEAERAGAKVLAAYLNDYPRDSPTWKQLSTVQRDEAHNCTVLIDLIRRVNGIPSASTGDFLGKALAVEDKVAKLRFLNRGQKWVARKINESLPYVEQGFVRGALFAMQESHLLNIEACDALAEKLAA